MKEKYLDADLEIILLDASDIITTSNEIAGGGTLPDDWTQGDMDSNGWT